MPDYPRSLAAFQRRFPDGAAVGPGRNQEPSDDGVYFSPGLDHDKQCILVISIAELCRRGGIAQSLYYRWSKEFLEAGKKRLAGDTARDTKER